MAVQGLTLGDDEVSFSARFSGQAESILVPVPAILAVYARENGQGMMFSDDDSADHSSGNGSDDGPDTDPDKPRPNLRVVK
jgi:stringent starvation protein B